MPDSRGEFVEIYKARGEIDASIVKGLLESNDIPAYVKSNASPSVHPFTVDGLGEYRVMVPKKLAGKARELISQNHEGNPPKNSIPASG